MDLLQQDLDSTYPLLNIQILGINENGLESSNAAITENRDLPWLQDEDEDANGRSDVWYDLWNITYRDVVVLRGDNSRFGTFNVTSNNLANGENYDGLRELLIDAAMETQKPWMNANNPLDVNNDGFVQPLDVLLIVNKINAEGTGDLPPPTGTQLPTTLYDCSGDNFISPLDVIQVVNFLNARSAANGEGEASATHGQIGPVSEDPSPHELRTTLLRGEGEASSALPEATRDLTLWHRQVDRIYSTIDEPYEPLSHISPVPTKSNIFDVICKTASLE